MSRQFNSILKKASKVGAQVYDSGREIYSSTARTIEQKLNDFSSDDTAGGDDDSLRAHNSNGVTIDVPRSVEINGERYRVAKLLDEGGFSYVFVVRNTMGDEFALKKLLIQEEEAFQTAMREIKFMKQLSGHENIISLMGDKTISREGKREVYILMELAEDSLISVIQRKAENRAYFKEEQILNIFLAICRSVAHMHSQDPAIIHRDLKIENVLIKNGKYKLCDFGSATTRVYDLSVRQDKLAAEEDIQKHTTMAYRSPEMADLYSRQTINEKSDVWALGCVLYKMCYFKGPFEDAGNLQIINCKYTIPENPRYSPKITNLFKTIFVSNPQNRPTVFDLIDTVGKLLGVETNVQRPEPRQRSEAPKPPPTKPKPQANNSGGGLFNMIDWYDEGGSTDSAKPPVSGQGRIAPPSPRGIAPPSPPVRTQSKDFGFGDEEEWNADFSEFEGDKPSPVSAPSTLPPRPKQANAPAKTHSPSLSGDLFSQLDWNDDAQQSAPKPKPQQLRPPHQHKRSHSDSVQSIDFTVPKKSSPTQFNAPRTSSPLTQNTSHSRGSSFDMNSLVTQLPKSAPSSHVTSPANTLTKSNSGADLLELNPAKRINVDQLFSSAYQQPQYQQPQGGYYQQAPPNMSQVNYYQQQYPQQYNSPTQYPPQFPNQQQ